MVRSIDLEESPGRSSGSPQDPPTWRGYVSTPLQLANVLLVLVPGAVFAWLVSRLPAEIPAHFDVHGEADRYMSPHELWSLGGVVAFDVLLLWIIVWGATKERWAMPEEGHERYFELQVERRTLIVRMVETVITAVNVAMVVVWLAIPIAALLGHAGMLGPTVVITVALCAVGALAAIVFYVPRMLSVQGEIRSLAGTEVLGTRGAGWRWGGLVYFAPDDPALFVPKRVGVGRTLNFARAAAWVFILLVIVLPLGITFGAIALAD